MMLRSLLVVCGGEPESVVVIVNVVEPAAVGVPEITPVAVSSERPGGKLPVAENVYGGVPPVALTWAS